MSVKTLLSQTSAVGPGAAASFPGSDNIRTIQLNPQVGNVGFSGSIQIQGSNASSPGNNDYVTLVTLTYTGATQNFSIDIEANHAWIRAVIVTSTSGSIAVYGDSRSGVIQGSQGANPASILVDSSYRVAGTGTGFLISSPVVPAITTDDVVYSHNFSQTLTDILDGTNGATGKQDKIGNGVITANQNDVNVLTGTAAYGLTTADLQKLADINASATELNRVIGLTGDIQTQFNMLSSTKVTGPGINLTGLTATVADLNSLTGHAGIDFSVLANLAGLTTSSADLNVFTNTAGVFTAADLTKLGSIQTSAADLNRINGYAGTSIDLNKLVGLTASTVDLNAVAGLAGTGVTSTQLGFLSGLNQNVQNALAALPNLAGLTASVNDLNTLSGIFNGTGPYAGSVSPTEISYLDGVVSNIQTQLNNRRQVGVTIGIAEITDAAITTTELNYLQGTRSNVQAQLDAISGSVITPSNAVFTGPVSIASGSVAAPGLRFAAVAGQSTGIYLFGANGFGISVAGAPMIAADTSRVTIGNPTATGVPVLRGVSPNATNPAYSFANDLGSGMYLASAGTVGFSANQANMLTLSQSSKTVTIGGPVADNNTVNVSGMFGGEKLVASQTVQCGTSASLGQTPFYTVPVGRNLIVTRILFVISSISASADNAFRLNVGYGVNFNDVLDNTNNPTVFNPPSYTFRTVGQVMPVGVGDNTFPAVSGNSGAAYAVVTPGTNIVFSLTATDGVAADFTLRALMFGYEYGA